MADNNFKTLSKVFGGTEGALKAQKEAKPLNEKYWKNQKNISKNGSTLQRALATLRSKNYK